MKKKFLLIISLMFSAGPCLQAMHPQEYPMHPLQLRLHLYQATQDLKPSHVGLTTPQYRDYKKTLQGHAEWLKNNFARYSRWRSVESMEVSPYLFKALRSVSAECIPDISLLITLKPLAKVDASGQHCAVSTHMGSVLLYNFATRALYGSYCPKAPIDQYNIEWSDDHSLYVFYPDHVDVLEVQQQRRALRKVRHIALPPELHNKKVLTIAELEQGCLLAVKEGNHLVSYQFEHGTGVVRARVNNGVVQDVLPACKFERTSNGYGLTVYGSYEDYYLPSLARAVNRTPAQEFSTELSHLVRIMYDRHPAFAQITRQEIERHRASLEQQSGSNENVTASHSRHRSDSGAIPLEPATKRMKFEDNQ